MRKANDKKKQKLKNVGTATALTITLASSNPALAYANELEVIANEEAIVEKVTETIETTEEVIEEIVEETIVQEEKEETVNEDAPTREAKRQATGQQELDLNEWDYAVYSSTIVLNKYKGSSSNVIIPAKTFVGQQFIPSGSTVKEGIKTVKMGTMDSAKSNDCFAGDTINRGTITNLEFKEVEGQKVQFSSITKTSFTNFTKLESIDLRGADLSILSGDMSELFSGCTSLETINLSGADLSRITYLSNVFKGCTAIKHIDLSNVTTSTTLLGASKMFEGLTSLETVNLDGLNISNVSNIHNMFNGCSSLKSVDLSKFDTSRVTNVTGLFLGCSSLTNVTFGGKFTTSSVTNFNNMFKDCTSLESINLNDIDTTSAKSMSYMFSDSGLEHLDLSNFNTEQVTDMTGMFRNTRNLKDIIFGDDFKTNNVTKMPFMFCNSNVESLDLSKFNTSNVIDMTAMFGSLDNIKILDLSNFVLNPNVNMHRMFARHISVASANANIIENQDENLKKELLVIATDEKLKSHNYEEDYCLPIGPTLDATGGQFENGVEVLELKTNVVERLDETTIDKEIESLLEKVVPTRDGYEFISWETQQTTRDKDSILDKLNTVYYAKWEAESTENPDVDSPSVDGDTTPENPDVPPVNGEDQEDNNDNSSTINPGNGNSSNESTLNPGSNNNPQTGDTGVLGSVGLGLTSVLGIFINNRKKKK